MAMKGISEAILLTKTTIIKRYMFFPRLSGQAKDRGNSLTETKNCHMINLQKATLDAAVA